MRLIDADAHEVFLTEQALRYDGENFTDKCMNTAYRLAIDAVHNAPTVDAVPTDFHDKCMHAEIQKRIRLEKIASLMCEGYLDMPSGCDGCPFCDTMVEDDEGNGICDLYRR